MHKISDKLFLTNSGFYTWYESGLNEKLSEHFMASEFECNPAFSERHNRIHKNLVDKLELIRQKFGAPIFITSGYRTKDYQNHLKERGFKTSKNVSQHVLGRAADITCQDKRKLTELKELCFEQFLAVGEAKTFIHVDLRDDKKRRWNYF